MELSIFRLRTSDVLVLCVLCLLALGVVMVQSASANAASDSGGLVGWSFSSGGSKQLIFAAASFAAFFLIGRINYSMLARSLAGGAADAPAAGSRLGREEILRAWRRSPVVWLMLIAALCNALVLVPHVGLTLNHARRWLRLGPVQFQPSELAKWGVVLFLSYFLTQRPLNLDRFFKGFVPMILPVAAICVLVVIEDFGTAALIAMCALAMLLCGRVRWRHLLVTVPPAMAGGIWLLTHTQYRWLRVTAFLNPYAAPQKEGYQMIQSFLSFATGGVTGRGLGNGIQKLGYLPEDTTDFIFSVICEEIGLFGALLTVALFLGIIYVTWQALRNRRDDFGAMLAFGIGTMVSLQAMINIAVATVSVPDKGLSLPLVSAGGTGLIITGAALGLLLSIVKREEVAFEIPATSTVREPVLLTPSSGIPGEGGGGGLFAESSIAPPTTETPTLTLPRSTGGGEKNLAAANETPAQVPDELPFPDVATQTPPLPQTDISG